MLHGSEKGLYKKPFAWEPRGFRERVRRKTRGKEREKTSKVRNQMLFSGCLQRVWLTANGNHFCLSGEADKGTIKKGGTRKGRP